MKTRLVFENVVIDTNNNKEGELCRDESRYGTKLYLNVHFEIGYDKRINIDGDDYFLLNAMYKYVNTSSKEVKENKKQ